MKNNLFLIQLIFRGRAAPREDKYEEFDLFSLPIPTSVLKKPEAAVGNELENSHPDPATNPCPNSHPDSTLGPVLESPQINQPETTTGRPLQVYKETTAQPCASTSP